MTVDVVDLPADAVGQACELFSNVFGHPVTPGQWQWKYHAGPRLGQVNVAARNADGRWVGHAGASVFPGTFRGLALPMAQVCDIMVERGVRGGLGGQGVYPRLVAGLRERLKARFPGVYAYGFPGTRPFRLGERIGFYRRLAECRVATLDPAAPSLPRVRTWTAVEAVWDGPRLDRLWARLGPAQPAPAVTRTGAWLAWRYRDHPQHAYRLWILRRWFRDAGWLVTRAMPDGTVYLVDAFLPSAADAAAACAALCTALATGAAEAGVAAGGGAAPGGTAGPAAAGPPLLRTWLALPQPVPSPIVPTEFIADRWHDDWPAPAFQPGDTDVF
jgi:hypothetical protein